MPISQDIVLTENTAYLNLTVYFCYASTFPGLAQFSNIGRVCTNHLITWFISFFFFFSVMLELKIHFSFAVPRQLHNRNLLQKVKGCFLLEINTHFPVLARVIVITSNCYLQSWYGLFELHLKSMWKFHEEKTNYICLNKTLTSTLNIFPSTL